MAMFNAASEKSGSGAREDSQALSILAAGMRVVGEIEGNGIVKVEGTVEGSVRSQGQVLVAKGGLVAGDIRTREAIIGGQVRGGIVASERIEVQAGSSINGDLTAPRLVIHEGGDVNGQIKMRNGAEGHDQSRVHQQAKQERQPHKAEGKQPKLEGVEIGHRERAAV